MEFTGAGELQKKLAEIGAKYPVARDKALKQEAEELVRRTKANTQGPTGNLKAGWERTQPVNGSIKVGNSVEYVNHVEYGHRLFTRKTHKFIKFVPGQKMLHIALDSVKTTFKSDMQEILKGVFK